MSGQDGNRGYLVQAIIVLLESLSDSSWKFVTIEPNLASEKIDVLWEKTNQSRVVQIKSSRNQINKSDAERWAIELKRGITAEQYELILIGPTAQSVVEMKSFEGVVIPCPKNLDIEGLLNEAAHLLDKLLTQESINQQSPQQRELMIRALVTEFSSSATVGKKLSRDEFIDLLKTWIRSIDIAPDIPWERISFENQRGIENAIAGKRLGPSDVEACPEFSICDEIACELHRSHLHEISGTSGCGKSITAWQIARRFDKLGFEVWRPRAFETAQQLLTYLPTGKQKLLVVDDAHQYGTAFANRLGELSSREMKVLLVSTVENRLLSQVMCLSSHRCVEELANALRDRSETLLPIVQQFDKRVGNRSNDLPLERRINEARKQNRPWEVFWVIRGGWQTAEREIESVKQFPQALEALLLIAVSQVVSCDTGVTRSWLTENLRGIGMPDDTTERALQHLDRLGVILRAESIRTKHLTYATRILELYFRHSNSKEWPQWASIVAQCILNTNWSLRGVTWIFGDSIGHSDALRWGQDNFRILLEPLMNRCLSEAKDYDWAAGCMSRLINCFEISAEQILKHQERILMWATSGNGLAAYFCGDIINTLINKSQKNAGLCYENFSQSLVERVDVTRLLAIINEIELPDFYSFAHLLDRLSYSKPSWARIFIQGLNWERLRTMILNADATHAYAIDHMVSSLVNLASSDDKLSLRYIEEIVPFLSRAINDEPNETITNIHHILWMCLGFGPKFLMEGQSADAIQRSIAEKIAANVDPTRFSDAMENAVSRDLEGLARSFAFLHEVDDDFVSRVVATLSEKKFFAATEADWQDQSRELDSLIRYFAIGKNCEPAGSWIRANKEQIRGPLNVLFVCIAPDVAIEFHVNGKGIELVRAHNINWSEISYAIVRLGTIDMDRCREIVNKQFSQLQSALYQLSLHSRHHIVRFFKVLFELSPALLERFVDGLDLDNAQCIQMINQLLSNQPKERSEYRKLAKFGMRFSGKLGELAAELCLRLNTESKP